MGASRASLTLQFSRFLGLILRPVKTKSRESSVNISKSELKWRPWPYSILYIHRMKEKDFRPMSIATTDITFMYLFPYFYPVLSPTRKSFSITSKSLPIHLLVTSLILTSTAVERPNKDAIPIPSDLAICAALFLLDEAT